MLSIVIPYYNSPIQLDRLLESIPDVSWIEVFIVDDNSTNLPSEFYLSRSNVTLTKNKSQNKGAGSARNTGLALCTRKFVLFADSDDYFTEHAFKYIYKIIVKDSNFDIFYFKPTSVDKDSRLGTRHLPYCYLLDEAVDRVAYDFHVPWSKLIRLSYLRDNNIVFDEVLASNDVMFSLKSSFYTERVLFSESTIYCVTESAGSLTKRNDDVKIYNSRVNVLISYNRFLAENGVNDYQKSFLKYIIYAFYNFGFKYSVRLTRLVVNKNQNIFPSLSEVTNLYYKKMYMRNVKLKTPLT